MKIIAMVSCGIDESYHNPLVQSFVNKCAEHDCHVLWFQALSPGSYDTVHCKGERNIFNLINYDIIDAVVIMTLTIKNKELLEQIVNKARKHNLPIISIDGYIEDSYNIYLGYVDALEEMVRHIITRHNAKNIKFLSGEKGNEESDARENVFRKVMAEYNLELTEDNIDYGYFWWATAADAVQRHYDKHGSMPDAFVCANDSMAVGVCGKLTELGYKVPDDVIVTGIDGIPEGNTYFPSITTLMLDIKSAGTTAAERTIQIIEGKASAIGNETVNGTILYRESCGCEPARLSSEDNDLKQELYEKINLWNGFSDKLILMTEAVTNSSSFKGTLENLMPFLSAAWAKECWLCICEDFVSNDSDPSSHSAENQCCTDYSKTIKYVIHGIDDREFEFVDPFSSTELVPDFKNVITRQSNLMFLPLNFRERTIGYFAIEFTNSMRNYHILRAFINNISRVLENARIQSELKSVVNRLEEMYIRDSMTTLYNRRGFYRLVPQIYNRCRSNQTGFMVISIDMDNLKGINDTYGHAEGDNAITTVANTLIKASDNNEIIARFGGDEYIVAGACPYEGYDADYLKKFHDLLDNYNSTSNKPYKVGASCGMYSLVPPPEKSLDEFIKSADELMYKEKITHRMHGYSRGRT